MVDEADPLKVLEDAIPKIQSGSMLDTITSRARDKFINDVIENPLDVLSRIDTTSEILTKLAPTLPGEFPIPIPRGIYDKIKDSPIFKQQGVK